MCWPSPIFPFPNLVGISHIPLFTREGQLQTQSGYDPGTGYWLSLAPDLALDSDTPMSCREAMALLLDDCLGDFPFEEPASKAHALAALLLPFVRPMIDEPTPLHLFDASSAGSGKSTLASLVALVATGDNPAMLTEATNQDEWRKRLTAALLGGPSVVVLDNLSRRLDSPDLAAVLTSSIWTDRILGRSELAHLPVQAVWLATGNNVQLSNELTRRTILCRLKPQQERPWERKDYKHPQYPKWVKENRSRLIQAILTLIRHWFDTGQPPGEATLG
jgi:putative DNA primase/helicase